MQFYDIKQAAAAVRVSVRQFYRVIDKYKIPTMMVNGKCFVKVRDIDKLGNIRGSK